MNLVDHYEETDSFCELTEDAYRGDFDSRFASGGAFAASNTVVFPVETMGGNYCFASEEDCCELNAGLVAGIVIGCTVGLTLLIVVRVVLQVLLFPTEGAARATGGRDDATRVRVAEISVCTGVRPICVVGWFVSLLGLLVWT